MRYELLLESAALVSDHEQFEVGEILARRCGPARCLQHDIPHPFRHCPRALKAGNATPRRSAQAPPREESNTLADFASCFWRDNRCAAIMPWLTRKSTRSSPSVDAPR